MQNVQEFQRLNFGKWFAILSSIWTHPRSLNSLASIVIQSTAICVEYENASLNFAKHSRLFSGEVEVDESFFGARRIKVKRGRGASGKTIVFGILKRNGKVYTEIVPDCSKASLQAIIRGRVSLESVIYSDGWRGYNGLVDVGYGKHLRVDHGQDEFANGSTHVNGIEGFWGFSKTRLSKFRGMNKSTFYLHLKECEFRFNYRQQNLYKLLFKIIKKHPLF